jgi:hypothetical protein
LDRDRTLTKEDKILKAIGGDAATDVCSVMISDSGQIGVLPIPAPADIPEPAAAKEE